MIIISNLQYLGPATTGNGRQGQATTSNDEQQPPGTSKNEQEPTRIGEVQIGVILWPWRDGGVLRRRRTSNARLPTFNLERSERVHPEAADHKKKISDSKNEGLKTLTCGLTVTYILGSRKNAPVRHPKRTRFLPKRAPIIPNRVQIVTKRIRIVPEVRDPALTLGGSLDSLAPSSYSLRVSRYHMVLNFESNLT